MQYIHNTSNITFMIISQVNDKVILKAVAIGKYAIVACQPYHCSVKDLDIALTPKKQSFFNKLFK